MLLNLLVSPRSETAVIAPYLKDDEETKKSKRQLKLTLSIKIEVVVVLKIDKIAGRIRDFIQSLW